VSVPGPDSALPEQLIAESPHWIGAVGHASETTVTVELSALAQRWRLGLQPPEQADHTATLDLRHDVWRLAAGDS